jgi:hypothetical protein
LHTDTYKEWALRENGADNMAATRELSDRRGLCALLKNRQGASRACLALANGEQHVQRLVSGERLFEHMRDRLAVVFTDARLEQLSLNYVDSISALNSQGCSI